jgi:NAD(P)-dependent dehydrogenase (short-subunit alcohol dehydrogenase family)
VKTYVVTGVSRGLGKAVAALLLEQGHKVIGTFNTNSESAEALQQIYDKLEIQHVDLLDADNLSRFINSLKEIELDGIINSAGVFLDIEFKSFDKKAFEDTFRINTFAPLYLVHGLSPNLKQGSSIVNVASNDALVGSIVGIAYSASKAALINITQSLANTLSDRKIRANAVAPGWMGDGMQAPEELLKLAADYNPLKRAATYEEVAKTVLFLLSEDSSYINGTTIIVDGGDMATNYILQQEAKM